MIGNLLFSSAPLILASLGALFSEYAGVLAVFADGIITLSAFFTYTFALFTGNIFVAVILSAVLCSLMVLGFGWFIEKTRMNPFLSATAMNLFFNSLTSVFSFFIFHTRGVLVSQEFSYDPLAAKLVSVGGTFVLVILSMLFLFKTKHGMYLRVTGSDNDVLEVKGISASRIRIYAWGLSAFFAALAGSILAVRINSFVPNISAGRGWIALAAVFAGKKKLPWITAAVILFCAADYFGITLQTVLPGACANAIPYFAAVILISLSPEQRQ